jgi:hypothetical protein
MRLIIDERQPRSRKEAPQSQQEDPAETEEADRYSFRKARGIIPYREGQERSEDIIRRGRGGDA